MSNDAWKTKEAGQTLLTARWVVGHENGRHVLFENGEVVYENGRIVFVGHHYRGPVARRIDHGMALIGPGFVDLDALSDLDTGVLGLVIAGSGATLVHCPLVMARHGAALDHFSRLRGSGLRIGMGTDTWPPDMILNMQFGLMLGRVMAGEIDTPKSADLYDAATIGGADALHRPDLGRLQPGAAADIVVIDLSNDRLGQIIDPIACLLTSACGRDVHTVIISGRTVMAEGRIPGFDFEAAHQRAQAQFERLVARYPERTWRHPSVNKIFPPTYRRLRA
ncbi:amidohydrolase family protein [Rhizobium grahamii]|uniref:N-ethylammeline chlorohydrolase n=1 Tax=Rhizobium grahamii CCGE 502 TaxID=990285 RepID=S3HWB5_9HYPH|nr:amidohydrolase family protein [Rhizobium grahamii]EPE97466.1 N-ethylammeline chlorohydrolase [Rhizobium grahamii CCGE 502]